MEIPRGLCQCGCGKETNPSPNNQPSKGIKKGEPLLYVHGHNAVAKFKVTPDVFWAKVAKGDTDACWEWQGRRLKHQKFDYGIMMYQGKRQYTHRLAWTLTHGTISDGLSVLHKCDNPPCCNPNHLFLGTYKDNFDDMAIKGRNYPPPGTYKLTQSDVDEIRRLHSEEGLSGLAISKRYDVCHSHVCGIISRKFWK